MPQRSLAILLTMLVGIQALLGGLNGAAVMCFGGGHEHELAEAASGCELACEHAEGWPGPVPGGDHGDDCGCVDIEIGLVELLSLPRSDSESTHVVFVQPTPAWVVIELGHGVSWTGPPMPPAWFDPGGTQRLTIISSTRLIL